MDQIGLSRADLARKLGTSQAAITNTLRGDANLTIDRMARLAHALDSTVHVHLAPAATKVRWFEVHDAGNAVPRDQITVAKFWAKQAVGGKDAKRPTPFAA
jgi:transcriptional regulator with XRE-family HTH domain